MRTHRAVHVIKLVIKCVQLGQFFIFQMSILNQSKVTTRFENKCVLLCFFFFFFIKTIF